MFTIATWNVNSLRVRLPHLEQWLQLQAQQPDVLALQETKVEDSQFPLQALQDLGYQAVFAGQKSYNGVAILSRLPIDDVQIGMAGVDSEQKRIIGATIAGVRIWNLYVPNGSSVGSDKYEYKLQWLSAVQAYLHKELQQQQPMVVVGDFNIAPTDQDVHDPKAWEGSVLVSEAERERLLQLMQLGFTDCFRQCSPTETAYSWWDYRQMAFYRNNGLRIDHILANTLLAPDCQACWIDKQPRKWERPSDHAPVIAEFKR